MPIPKKTFAVLDLPVLTDWFRSAGLIAVDIGGRGAALADLLTLAPFVHYVVCEPDAEEAARLRETLPREAPWRGVTVMTEAIAPVEGTATLYFTAKAGMSSLLEPDPAVVRRLCLAPRFKVTSTAEVPTVPLDTAAARYGFEDASFLKIDTQGTELEILQSGRALVGRSVLGIYTESLFQPIYRNQTLFADVDTHLRAQGFTLFSVNRTLLRRRHHRADLFSRRMAAWVHALYLREPSTVAVPGSGEAGRRRAVRLLALAIGFQHFDLAFETLDAIRAAELADASEVTRALAEVDACARLATRYLQEKAQEPDGDDASREDALLASTLRDRAQRS